MALIDKFTAIGNAIRAKTGKSELLTLDEMAVEIAAIETGGGGGDLPEEILVTGDVAGMFQNGHWDWFIESLGNRVKTKDLTNMEEMFLGSKAENIPFELNGSSTANYVRVGSCFEECSNLKSIPKMSGKITYLTCMFLNCYRLRELPEDIESWFDWSYQDSNSGGAHTSMFNGCYSLRSIPMGFLNHGKPASSNGTSYFYNGFRYCYALDELVGLPLPYTATWTSNAFNNTFQYCNRLKNLTFATPNGAPYVMNWKSQTIDLTQNLGWAVSDTTVIDYNSGITKDKHAWTAATYQELKNDKDWYTCNYSYSRYNHDSAVATINSLPDTSAYLATQSSGTNTIKFRGAAGQLTDGGAINTLTAEEIAVAAAKGWTVTLV